MDENRAEYPRSRLGYSKRVASESTACELLRRALCPMEGTRP
jgi:hypothetical protein